MLGKRHRPLLLRSNSCSKNPVALDEIVTHRFKIEDAVEAFSLDTGQTGKVTFEWDG